ncbi:MAG: ABC transporter ATP-binding protein [Sphaerochaetaceae bacterium]|nr:ABC transporter ATP-binding protein [Spirochaetales bacterium]MDY5500468.1 ABC transporter ATP-binding protein [Sphaerochaetaceae bacterium]
MSLIVCDHLSFAYGGETVVDDVSFHVDAGWYLSIVGENGAGKSTLVKGLLHLKAPTLGTIRFGEGLREDEIGYLPQQTEAQRNFPASVGEVVLSGCLNHLGWRIWYSKEQRKRAEEQMEKLGIALLRDHCYRELSGGQQQRVLLARALCAARKVLLLDEPVTGLDPIATRTLYQAIRMLHEERHMTILMVSHDIQSAVAESDHILHLARTGRFFGSTREYQASPMGRAYLEGGQP